jgi:hypothetical protein
MRSTRNKFADSRATRKKRRSWLRSGGVALTFRVAKPFKVVLQEWKKEMERGGEE